MSQPALLHTRNDILVLTLVSLPKLFIWNKLLNRINFGLCYIERQITSVEAKNVPIVMSFGPFEVDLAAGELRKHGTRIPLARQPFQILAFLLRRPGEVVAREELQQQLWAGDTFVDFEKGLNTAVNKLRQSLGDSADKPRYVETLPGRGYRFVAAVQISSLDLAPSVIPKPNREPAPIQSARLWIYAILALAVLGVAGFSMAWVNRKPAQPFGAAIRFTIAGPPGTILEPSGSRQGFAVSPDGTRLAAIPLAQTGMFGVWVRDLNSLDFRELTNTDGVHSLFWSEDSRALFFTIFGSLRRSAPEGGSFQVVTELATSAYQVALLPQGRLLVSSRRSSYTVPSTGGAASEIAERYTWPQALPDGKRILSVFFDERIHRNRVRASVFGGGSNMDLLESDSRVQYAPSQKHPGSGYLLYIRAGNLLAQRVDAQSLRVEGDARPLASNIFYFLPTGAADFSVSQNGILVYLPFAPQSRLIWVDRKGNEVAQIGPSNIAVKYARLSPDGRKVAAPIYDVAKGVTETWIFDVATGAGRRLASIQALVDAPVWSPDSSRIIVGRADGGAPTLYMVAIGDKDTEKALSSGSFQLPSDWSMDGRLVAYTNTVAPGRIANEREGDVSVFDLRANTTVPLLNSRAHETGAVFSPDGKWIAFISNDSGRQELYVQRFTAGETPRTLGERRLVSRNGALTVRWRRDGKEIFYLGLDSRLYSVAVRTGDELFTAKPDPLFTIPLASRAALPTTFGFDASPDGTRFLVPVATNRQAAFVAVHNWEATF